MNKYAAALVSAFALFAVAGCGSPTLTCTTATCNSGAMSYQACSHVDGTVDYKFGGMTCTCSPGNTSQCQACTNTVAAWCGAGSGGSGGGGGGGSGGGGGGGSSCSIVGNFGATVGNGGHAASTWTGTSASGTYHVVITLSSGAMTTIDGSYAVSGSQITLTNSAVSPSTVQGCIGQAAVYNTSWDATCANVTFTKVSDACQGRIGDLNGNTLTRQ